MVSGRDMFYAVELAYQANEAFNKGPEGAQMHDGLVNLVGMAIGPETEGTSELYARPKASVAEAFLRTPYGEHLSHRHQHFKQMADVAIRDSILSPSYELPEIESFITAADRLLPSYYKMEAKGWAPELVMAPHLLTFDQWNNLLSGHPDQSEDGTTSGLTCEFPEAARGFSNVSPSLPMNNWSLAVMSTKLAGIAGNDPANRAVDSGIGELVDASDAASPKDTIQAVSPSLDTYMAYQWSQISCGNAPLDAGIESTMLREDISVGSAFSQARVIGSWSLKCGQLRLGALPLDSPADRPTYAGVRPAIETTLPPYL